MQNKNIIIGENSAISPDCKFSGKVKIGKNCNITSSTLIDCVILDNSVVINSYIENSQIGKNVSVGPYCHIRPNCVILDDAKLGNFVEIKNAIIGERTKIPHLTYVGDAEIGKDVNIGCGVVFCNYDGKNKYKSYVGDRVFIGSNSNIIAPCIIENDAFICAGTTVTKDIAKNSSVISRQKDFPLNDFYNPYKQSFSKPKKYFGTDGIRGIYNQDFSPSLCEKVGFSLSKLKPNMKVLIGRDTRQSGKEIMNSLAKGMSVNKAQIYDAGIISTAGLAYLTKKNNFDYGIQITASHNISEYNGLKIFDSRGYKINENIETFIEENLKEVPKPKKYEILNQDNNAYLDLLKSICKYSMKGTKIFIDCANGAISDYAKQIFEETNAKVVAINIKKENEINKNASILDEQCFKENMLKSDCDIGFCFDGDADRVMCALKNGIVLDGDRILYLLAKYYNQKCVVGTIMTNMGLEKALQKSGIKLIRTDVGDRLIARMMKKKNYLLGAEQSGHIIISSLSTTGDGVLTALTLLNIFQTNKEFFEKAVAYKNFFVVNKKVKVKDKSVIKQKAFQQMLENTKSLLKNDGRIIVRPSGTEPVIRITVEGKNEQLCEKTANKIKQEIEKLI